MTSHKTFSLGAYGFALIARIRSALEARIRGNGEADTPVSHLSNNNIVITALACYLHTIGGKVPDRQEWKRERLAMLRAKRTGAKSEPDPERVESPPAAESDSLESLLG